MLLELHNMKNNRMKDLVLNRGKAWISQLNTGWQKMRLYRIGINLDVNDNTSWEKNEKLIQEYHLLRHKVLF